MASLALASLGLHRRSEQAQALGNLQEALAPSREPQPQPSSRKSASRPQALTNLQEALGPLFPPKEASSTKQRPRAEEAPASSPASGTGKSSTVPSRRSPPQALTNLEAALGGTLQGPSEQQSSGAKLLDGLGADGPSTAGFLDFLRSREEKPRTGAISAAKTNAAPHKAAEATRSVDLHTRQFKQQLNNLQEALSVLPGQMSNP